VSVQQRGRKRKAVKTAAQRRRVQARSAFVRAKSGAVTSELPANLPRKHGMTPDKQVDWLLERLPERGTASVAESYAGLEEEARDRGLFVHRATRNDPGVGNAIISRRQFRSRSEYACHYQTNNRATKQLHMARVVTREGRWTYHTRDAIHIPSQGRYKSSTSPLGQAVVVRQIARQKAKTRSRTISGDINMKPERMLEILQSVDKGWRHLGGHGVEHTFGLNVRGFGDASMSYPNDVSDHEHTAKTSYGVRGRVI